LSSTNYKPDCAKTRTYQNFADAVARQRSVASIGIRSILPSTFTGSRRDMLGRYHDAMAIVRRFSKPDLFQVFVVDQL
jgi:hypothetical protein